MWDIEQIHCLTFYLNVEHIFFFLETLPEFQIEDAECKLVFLPVVDSVVPLTGTRLRAQFSAICISSSSYFDSSGLSSGLFNPLLTLSDNLEVFPFCLFSVSQYSSGYKSYFKKIHRGEGYRCRIELTLMSVFYLCQVQSQVL